MGYVCSAIVHLGPSFSMLTASSQSYRTWVGSWQDYYHDAIDLEWIRKSNEKYIAKIMNYGDGEMDRIRDISSPNTIARSSHNCSRSNTTTPWLAVDINESDARSNEQRDSTGSMICLGTNKLMALVPSASRVGDVVVQFLNCSAAIIMRPTDPEGTNSPVTSFTLVGRADVAGAHDRGNNFDSFERDVDGPSASLADDANTCDFVQVDMDVRTLQVISASVTTC